MKIAYIILAYNNPIHLQRLIRSLDTENNSLYIHIDKKADISTFNLVASDRLYIETQRQRVYWGEFNQVVPVIKLLREATKTHHDYYVLLYGSDYPVKSNTYIENYLTTHKNKEFIHMGKMPEMDKTLDRIDYHHFLEANRNNTPIGIYKRALNQVIRKINLKRKLPIPYRSMTLYGGCPWWILTENCIRYVLDFIDNNPAFVKFWENTLIPDETFFHTIIGNSSFF